MSFRLADSVSMRLVQIFQEAMMTGVDGADLLRQVRLELDESDPTSLVLTREYTQQFTEALKKLEAEALTQHTARQSTKLIVGD